MNSSSLSQILIRANTWCISGSLHAPGRCSGSGYRSLTLPPSAVGIEGTVYKSGRMTALGITCHFHRAAGRKQSLANSSFRPSAALREMQQWPRADGRRRPPSTPSGRPPGSANGQKQSAHSRSSSAGRYPNLKDRMEVLCSGTTPSGSSLTGACTHMC